MTLILKKTRDEVDSQTLKNLDRIIKNNEVIEIFASDIYFCFIGGYLIRAGKP